MFTPSAYTPGYVMVADEALPVLIASVITADPKAANALLNIVLSGAEWHPSVALKTAEGLQVFLTEGLEGFNSYLEAEMVLAQSHNM